MLIKFTKTIWLNISPQDVDRIDIDAKSFEDLTENAYYYVIVTFNNGNEEQSDYFKTFEEARACAENLVELLNKEAHDDDF